MNKIIIPKKKWQDITEEEFGGKRENTVCLVRYGGFGDVLQITSILPLLKNQGIRVCVNVTELGANILENNQFVDELLIQTDDQVPNNELWDYWEKLETLFSDFINLSQIIESNLLCTPNQEKYSWPKSRRHRSLNKNYSEALHKKAKVPNVFNVGFYPTETEVKWVKRQRNEMRLGSIHFVVLIALSGSSIHKAYPYMDAVMAYLLMTWPFIRFVTVGDEACKILEAGWEKEDRVFCRSGKWSVRQAISFAQKANLVLGPETGILNAVSTAEIPKVCLLSHSSDENLTKHWVNTTSITPIDTKCYPCHQMHYSFTHCNRDDETGASMCAARINPEEVVNAIEKNWIAPKEEFNEATG